MRYLDWDVLLFPDNTIEPERNHIPLKEFRTTCYALSDGASTEGITQRSISQRHAGTMPLLNCFVPSLPAGSIFYLSVHCWSSASLQFPSTTKHDASGTKAWQVKIIIDGQSVTCDLMQVEGPWPHAIHLANTIGSCGHTQHLRFPAFNRTTATSRAFNAADTLGRIKVEIVAGMLNQRDGLTTFEVLEKIVCFSFVHAPMDHLERCGLAWPNPAMFNNPIHNSSLLQNSPSISDHGHLGGHRGLDLSSPGRFMPAPPPPTPSSLASLYQQYTNDDVSCYDLPSSRDTSYSFVRGGNPNQTLTQASRLPDLSSDLPDLARNMKGPQMSTPTFTSINVHTKEMLPPPLPSHVFNTEADILRLTHTNIRDQSRGSDISMHTGCNSFPACMSEDQDGHIQHMSPIAPATVVRSKKDVKTDDPAAFALPLVQSSPLSDIGTAELESPGSPTELTGTSKKRKGSTLRTITGNSSPTKSARKVGRKKNAKSTKGMDKENMPPAADMSVDD